MSCGYHNEHTGNKDDGNFYCNVCGNQVPIGFKHHHASEVPTLKKEIQELGGKIKKQGESGLKAFLLVEKDSLRFHGSQSPEIKFWGIAYVMIGESAKEVAEKCGGCYEVSEERGFRQNMVFFPKRLFAKMPPDSGILSYHKDILHLYIENEKQDGIHLYILEKSLL